ncbi:quinohemoprotein amine dehydrogenase subunit alpha [Amphritea sp. HPY]|uniref:quinohemoprotein amine dehydrogenase subunit alpha n=1 Tax=Amphritea sp. HPY TaxID=3421652 RepID=UPI003D7C83EE
MNNNKSKRALLTGGALALMGAMLTPAASSAADGESVLRDKCLLCHTQTGDPEAPFSRISQQRKTPEGWHMTINRMQRLNGLVISGDEVQAVVKYLSDTQGLAPSETAPHRYVLEQKPNVVEDVDPAYVEMCARCHSNARFGLQRRTEGEWKLHVNTHMAINPTTELHALARDRSWYDIAYNDVAPKLAADYAFNDPAWKKWQQMAKPELAGSWSVAGFMPGKGDYSATLNVTKTSKDNFSLTMQGHYADGTPLQGSGNAKVFAGYEWRASLTVDGVKMRQVLAASEDGSSLTGRMFQTAHDEIGGELKAVSGKAIVALSPSAIKQGGQQQITIIGSGLKGNVSLGNGVQVIKVLSRDADRVVVLAKASANASVGLRSVAVGNTKASAQLAVYDSVAAVQVMPNESIARVGGNGGKIPKMKSTYRALAFSAGADGKPGTEDDMRLGYMPAQWSLQPFDEVAEHDNDLQYAGAIDGNGVFTPGDAGLNPERKMSTNNVGNLKVVAQVIDGDNAVEGDAHLLVTVPVFIKRAIQ